MSFRHLWGNFWGNFSRITPKNAPKSPDFPAVF
nr:MAG TPA: hypothetical protein [Caudoviricetes sp.]